jgi:hypothetical protein
MGDLPSADPTEDIAVGFGADAGQRSMSLHRNCLHTMLTRTYRIHTVYYSKT